MNVHKRVYVTLLTRQGKQGKTREIQIGEKHLRPDRYLERKGVGLGRAVREVRLHAEGRRIGLQQWQ
jgi:hypothetical protein